MSTCLTRRGRNANRPQAPDGAQTQAAGRNLSEVPDTVPLYAEAAGIAGLLHGRKAARTMVSRSSGPHHRPVLIRQEGKTCLRSYVLPQFAQAVTAPPDSAHREDGRGADGWGEIALTDVQTDGHFHNK